MREVYGRVYSGLVFPEGLVGLFYRGKWTSEVRDRVKWKEAKRGIVDRDCIMYNKWITDRRSRFYILDPTDKTSNNIGVVDLVTNRVSFMSHL